MTYRDGKSVVIQFPEIKAAKENYISLFVCMGVFMVGCDVMGRVWYWKTLNVIINYPEVNLFSLVTLSKTYLKKFERGEQSKYIYIYLQPDDLSLCLDTTGWFVLHWSIWTGWGSKRLLPTPLGLAIWAGCMLFVSISLQWLTHWVNLGIVSH